MLRGFVIGALFCLLCDDKGRGLCLGLLAESVLGFPYCGCG